MIIAVEGIDASGKETQVRLLKQWAMKDDRWTDVHEQDFPDYTNTTGRLIKGLFRKKWGVVDNELAEKRRTQALVLQSLMLANRHEHALMLEAYENDPHRLLILDRYYASGMVYGMSDGLDEKLLERIHYLLPEPKVWVLIDISAQESFRRRPERQDYMESSLARMEETRRLYRELFETRQFRGDAHWKIVDGTGSVNDVHLRVREVILDAIQ